MNEQDHQQHYQKQKQQTKLPAHIKNRVMRAARQEQTEAKPNLLQQWNWLLAVGCVTGLFLLFELVSYSRLPFEDNHQYTQVHIHKLEQEPFTSASQQPGYNQKIEQFQYAYQQRQQQNYAFHRKQKARLINNQGSWELATCDDQLIKISSQLMAELFKQRKVEEQLLPGNPVVIEFDQRGRIIRISDSQQMC